MATHFGTVAPKNIRPKKKKTTMKKSDSESVVQDRILHICDTLLFIYAWN